MNEGREGQIGMVRLSFSLTELFFINSQCIHYMFTLVLYTPYLLITSRLISRQVHEKVRNFACDQCPLKFINQARVSSLQVHY